MKQLAHAQVSDGVITIFSSERIWFWTRTFQANLFVPSSTLNPVGRKKTVFSVWERTGRDWMAAAWAVAQPLMGVFVGGPSGADYLGGNCLPRWA